MTRIYTKAGDDGTTGLIGGSRVSKFDNRLEAYGTVDELNSAIGLMATHVDGEHELEVIRKIQETLFVIGSHLATDESVNSMQDDLPCKPENVQMLELEMNTMAEVLPKLTSFILPGGCQAAAFAHLARTICRRAERRIVELGELVEIDENLMKFINRLSDYLFVLARFFNVNSNTEETLWSAKEK